jgi:hypothetical protein
MRFPLYSHLILALLAAGGAHAGERRIDWERLVEASGFSIRTDESLQELLRSDKAAAQKSAIRALASTRPKDDAIDRIKPFLAVSDLEVRATAAGALADLGDRSGLKPMQEAFREWVPLGSIK